MVASVCLCACVIHCNCPLIPMCMTFFSCAGVCAWTLMCVCAIVSLPFPLTTSPRSSDCVRMCCICMLAKWLFVLCALSLLCSSSCSNNTLILLTHVPGSLPSRRNSILCHPVESYLKLSRSICPVITFEMFTQKNF
jgi:hypothetical protein